MDRFSLYWRLKMMNLFQHSAIRTLGRLLFLLFLLLFYCEYVVYYVVLLQCTWPALDVKTVDSTAPVGAGKPLRAMFIADTHLLGWREGHWFDKLRREWQMERSFQTAMTIHDPDVVFVLGDLFDEGKWCSDEEFKYHVERFKKMFRVSSNNKLQVVVGNHDIGFHSVITEHKRVRFQDAMKSASVKMLRIRDNVFILLNSMALEGDGCSMCSLAETKLRGMATQLRCAKGVPYTYDVCTIKDNFPYVKPILLQHFPLYRKSDANCTGPDAAPPEVKYDTFRERYDCLSKKATKQLLRDFHPRLAITAHTHHFCHMVHEDGTPEWTLPSFSWRNKRNPSFLLGVFSNNNYSLSKCYLPYEYTVVGLYVLGITLLILWLIVPRNISFISRTRKVH